MRDDRGRASKLGLERKGVIKRDEEAGGVELVLKNGHI